MSIPFHILLHVLTAVITLAIGLSLNMFSPVARVVEVDSEALMRQFVTDLGNAPDAVVKETTGRFVTTMQNVLDRFALENGVIVVEAKLAIAGARDISDEAYRQVMFIMPTFVAEARE